MTRLLFFLSVISLLSCRKNNCDPEKITTCDIQAALTNNPGKVTITNGIWGTISFMEGNCMPVVNPNTCKHCPVQRKVRIYEYTTSANATPIPGSPGFYSAFNTQLLGEVNTDAEGFYQFTLAPGTYTRVTIEDGKIHASFSDGQGGLNPVTINPGRNKHNLALTYRAIF